MLEETKRFSDWKCRGKAFWYLGECFLLTLKTNSMWFQNYEKLEKLKNHGKAQLSFQKHKKYIDCYQSFYKFFWALWALKRCNELFFQST